MPQTGPKARPVKPTRAGRVAEDLRRSILRGHAERTGRDLAARIGRPPDPCAGMTACPAPLSRHSEGQT